MIKNQKEKSRLRKMEYMGKSYVGVEAFCFKRNEDRVFRVDRILELAIDN